MEPGFSHDLSARKGLTLTGRSCGIAIGPQVPFGEQLVVMPVRIHCQQQAGPFLDKTYAGMLVPMHTAFMPFGQAEPPFQVEIILQEIALPPPDKEAPRKARHHLTEMEADWIRAGGELLAKLTEAVPTLTGRAGRRIKRGVHRPQVLPLRVRRQAEPGAARPDPLLGPADPLGHRGLGHQVGPGDLGGGQPGHGP